MIKTLIKSLGSLSFALFLLGMLTLLLTVSTLTESAYGTPFAQKIVYNAGWFDLFLGLFAVNILFSALSRWPYKRHHTGFLTTHLGILLLLAGSLMTRLAGVEGQMALGEGEEKDFMLRQDYELTVHEAGGAVHHWGGLGSASRLKKPSLSLGPSRRLVLDRVEEGVLFSPEVRAGDPSSPPNHAVHFTLKSQLAHLDESFWLVENGAEPPFSNRLDLGMAEFALREGRPSSAEAETVTVSEPRIRLTQKGGGRELLVRLNSGKTADASSPEMGLTVSDVTYFPDARVDENNELVNASDAPKNPAVRFTLDDGKGQKEQRVIFSLFPDFESIHGKKSSAFQDIKVEFLAPRSELAAAAKSGVTFYFSEGAWYYEAHSKKGVLTGEVKKGLEQPAGWMDFSFRADELLDNAVVEKKAVVTGSSKKGDTGVLMKLLENGKELGSEWAVPGQPAHFETPEGTVVAVVGAAPVELPFRLQLIDFRKEDYPGTENAASYESDVKLQDPSDRVTIQKTIWMNHPLDYKGFRIFQSSFAQDPEAGETSIFTIAKNPGIPFIYAGAVVMFLGIVFVFYVKPFSYLSTRSPHGPSKK